MLGGGTILLAHSQQHAATGNISFATIDLWLLGSGRILHSVEGLAVRQSPKQRLWELVEDLQVERSAK